MATIRLIGVNTLARTISPTVRVEEAGIVLTWPLATRSATSAAVRPRVAASGSATAGMADHGS
jgi:hypothetical protein